VRRNDMNEKQALRNRIGDMSKYKVTVQIESDGGEWFYFFDADDFAHAEEQAIDYLAGIPEKIMCIEIEENDNER